MANVIKESLIFNENLNIAHMGKTQNFFEYQKMLLNEYATLDIKRLSRLCSIVAAREMNNVETALASKKFVTYKAVFSLAYQIIRNEDKNMRGNIVDECQRDLSAICHKLSRKTRLADEHKKSLSECAGRLLQFIDYLKTEDPLYLLTALEEMKTLDAVVVLEYQDQLALLERLKAFLKI